MAKKKVAEVDEWLYLAKPLHQNYLPEYPIPEDFKSNLLISWEGAIHGVKRVLVEDILKEPDIVACRVKYKKYEDKKIENNDDLLRLIAVLIEL